MKPPFYHYGKAQPMGATWDGAGFNFAIYSSEATSVTLLLFVAGDCTQFSTAYEFDPVYNKTGAVWHCFIPEEKIHGAIYYAYVMDGAVKRGNFFRPEKLLLDPWAKGVYFPEQFSRKAAYGAESNMGRAPLGCLVKNEKKTIVRKGLRPINELVIYEMHVRGFTLGEHSGVTRERKGTFSGVVDKIPYLKELGINAVELLPIHQFDPQEKNYWGYMTLNFFAPHHVYCSSNDISVQRAEFKAMVQALHDADIEVILDVVYNHTAEEDEYGPLYSYRGIDNSSYYLLNQDSYYINDAGTGNMLRTRHKIVRQLVIDSMRYWVEEMGVDGFRFDLASIFERNNNGALDTKNPPIIEEIGMDPVLSQVRLIAEPWDITAYQLGCGFPGEGWSQWNDRYRDDIRRFVRGDEGMVAALITRLYGSNDIFPDVFPNNCRPYQSINFVTAHDGFCLYDLVAYNYKHNEANGYNNSDGTNSNYSWNCGAEGDEHATEEVMQMRRQQARNFALLLMLSNGVPMLKMGDEFLHTQLGNNNPFNQDNKINWLNWARLKENDDFFQFFKKIIAFRRAHASISAPNYWDADVRWFGTGPEVDYSVHSRSLAYHLSGEASKCADIYVMINAWWEPLEFAVQVGQADEWEIAIYTSSGVVEDGLNYTIAGRSILVLEKKNEAPAGNNRSF